MPGIADQKHGYVFGAVRELGYVEGMYVLDVGLPPPLSPLGLAS